jgi:hypothetical protein
MRKTVLTLLVLLLLLLLLLPQDSILVGHRSVGNPAQLIGMLAWPLVPCANPLIRADEGVPSGGSSYCPGLLPLPASPPPRVAAPSPSTTHYYQHADHLETLGFTICSIVSTWTRQSGLHVERPAPMQNELVLRLVASSFCARRREGGTGGSLR